MLMCTWLIMGCKKEVPIHFQGEDSQPVLNLLMEKDSLMVASMSHSVRSGAMNIGFPPLTDATVQLYEDGVFKENLVPFSIWEMGFYKSTVKAKTGSTYRLVALVPGYGEVEGSDYIPVPATVGDMSVTIMASGRDYEHKARVSVEIHDKAGERNYYRIRLYRQYKSTDGYGNPYVGRFLVPFNTGDPQDTWFNGKERDQLFIDDALFDGHSPRFNLIASRWDDKSNAVVEVTALTADAYKYLYSAAMAEEKNDDPLSEKVIVFNNIKNGYGIVGGMVQQLYVVTP